MSNGDKGANNVSQEDKSNGGKGSTDVTEEDENNRGKGAKVVAQEDENGRGKVTKNEVNNSPFMESYKEYIQFCRSR